MYMLKENHGSEIFREYLNSTIQPQLLSYKLTDMGVTYGNASWPALSDTVVGSTGLPPRDCTNNLESTRSGNYGWTLLNGVTLTISTSTPPKLRIRSDCRDIWPNSEIWRLVHFWLYKFYGEVVTDVVKHSSRHSEILNKVGVSEATYISIPPLLTLTLL